MQLYGHMPVNKIWTIYNVTFVGQLVVGVTDCRLVLGIPLLLPSALWDTLTPTPFDPVEDKLFRGRINGYMDE